MSKTLVGIVSFGNTQFTKLTVDSIRDTAKTPVDFFIVVGKPGDYETLNWLSSEDDIAYTVHPSNMGFPYSINDIYDYAWKENDYDYVIIAGNDIVAYPYAIDSMIKLADEGLYEVISASQVDVRELVRMYPDTKKFFSGDNYLFYDFNSKPWEAFTGYSEQLDISDMQLLDIQNLCLYKKSIFEKVGYTDVAFYPAYFIDNDYANRIVRSGAKVCSLGNAKFFHFWSRTIHQGSGGSTSTAFEVNKSYYKTKWGGSVGHETATPDINITSRDGEAEIIEYYKRKSKA